MSGQARSVSHFETACGDTPILSASSRCDSAHRVRNMRILCPIEADTAIIPFKKVKKAAGPMPHRYDGRSESTLKAFQRQRHGACGDSPTDIRCGRECRRSQLEDIVIPGRRVQSADSIHQHVPSSSLITCAGIRSSRKPLLSYTTGLPKKQSIIGCFFKLHGV